MMEIRGLLIFRFMSKNYTLIALLFALTGCGSEKEPSDQPSGQVAMKAIRKYERFDKYRVIIPDGEATQLFQEFLGVDLPSDAKIQLATMMQEDRFFYLRFKLYKTSPLALVREIGAANGRHRVVFNPPLDSPLDDSHLIIQDVHESTYIEYFGEGSQDSGWIVKGVTNPRSHRLRIHEDSGMFMYTTMPLSTKDYGPNAD